MQDIKINDLRFKTVIPCQIQSNDNKKKSNQIFVSTDKTQKRECI